MNKAKEYWDQHEKLTHPNKFLRIRHSLKTMNRKTLEDVEAKTNPLINLIQRESDGNEMQLRAVLITVIDELIKLKSLKL